MALHFRQQRRLFRIEEGRRGRGSRWVFTARLSRPTPHRGRRRCGSWQSPSTAAGRDAVVFLLFSIEGLSPLSFVTVDVVGSAQVLGVTSLCVSVVPLSLRRVSPVSRNLLHANSVSLLHSALVSVFAERAPFPLFCRAINLAKTGARRRTNEEGAGPKERASAVFFTTS